VIIDTNSFGCDDELGVTECLAETIFECYHDFCNNGYAERTRITDERTK
jgi:hypothetical protein